MVDPMPGINQSADGSVPFFGRQTEIAWLVDQLARGERVILVCGKRHLGKTALLRQLERHPPEGFLAVYLDIGGTESGDSTSPLLQAASAVQRSVREGSDAHIEPPGAALFTDHPLEVWQRYLDTLAAHFDQRQLALLVDDADQADPEWLRILIQARTTIVLAMERQQDATTFLADVVVAPPSISLGPLSNHAAESLVKAAVTHRSQIDPWAVRRILEATSNHPYYIQLFCHTLLECCSYKSPLAPPEVEEALNVLLSSPLADFVEAWKSITPRERVILSVFGALRGHGGIATQYDLHKSCARHEHSIPLSAIVTTLNSLVQRGILEKLGTNSYRFTLELFRLWVHQHYPPERVSQRSTWGFDRSVVAARLTALGRMLSRQWALSVGLGVLLLIALIAVLQPALWRGEPTPGAPLTGSTVAVTGSARSTRSMTPASVSTNTLVPAPAEALPGYDLAFMSRANRNAPWQLYVMNSRTGKRLRLTETDSNERTPKWSPGGQSLVFASDRDGNREVYVMDLAGSPEGSGTHLRNLTRNTAPDWQPAWSPDGERIAFSSHRDGNWEIYIVHVDGTRLVRLTEHPENDFSPTWSPDGKKLLFVSRRYGDADLFIVDVDSGERTQLTTGELDEYDPAWSPDGEWIAFVTQIGDQSDLFVMRVDGSEPVNLTRSTYANDFQPAWLADSEWLAFVSYTAAGGDHELYRMRRDGTEMTPLTDDDADDLASSWRPNYE